MATAANPTRTPSGILTFIGGVLVLAIFAALVVLWVSSTGPKTTVEDRRAQLRREAAEKLQKENSERLATHGWVDRQKGIAHIPIESALQLAVTDLKGKQVAPSQMKLVPALPIPAVDPNSTEPPRPLLPSAPQGAMTVHFPVPGEKPAEAPAPVAPPAAPAATPPTAPPAPAPAPATTSAPAPAPAGPASDAVLAEGKKQYVMVCGACHQPTGLGLPPVFPPLMNSEYVKGDPKRMVAIMLKGVIGPITVEGKSYNNVMPGQGMMLNDKVIAAIGSFVRKEFGGGASAITPEFAAEVRKEFAPRVQPWTEAELKAFGAGAAPAPAEGAPAAAQPAAPAPLPPTSPAGNPAPAAPAPAGSPAENAAPAQATPPAPAPPAAVQPATPAPEAPAAAQSTPVQPAPAAPANPQPDPAAPAPAAPTPSQPSEPAAPAPQAAPPTEQPAPAPTPAEPAPAAAPQAPQASTAQVRPSLINWTESK